MAKTNNTVNTGEMYNPPHPGEVLKEMHLEPLGLTVTEAAERLDIDRKTLSRIVNGQAAISVDMALKLAKSLGTSAKVWMGMQQAYDLWHAKQNTDLSEVQGLHTVVIKNKEGRIIADYPVCVAGLNYQTKSHEYFDIAKRSLLEDGVIKRNELSSLSYELR